MKLAAYMLVRNEFDRYLQPAITHALTYCDEVRVVDEGSTDGGPIWVAAQERVALKRREGPGWAEEGGHEGEARKELLDWALAGDATHLIALDADELIPNGQALRNFISRSPMKRAWALRIVEVWGTDPWQIRVDGGWAPRHAPVAFRVVPGLEAYDLRLACPREPKQVSALFGSPLCRPLSLDLCHLGWADPAHREARAARYHTLDQGNFHQSDHLDSILWPDERVTLEAYPMPDLGGAWQR